MTPQEMTQAILEGYSPADVVELLLESKRKNPHLARFQHLQFPPEIKAKMEQRFRDRAGRIGVFKRDVGKKLGSAKKSLGDYLTAAGSRLSSGARSVGSGLSRAARSEWGEDIRRSAGGAASWAVLAALLSAPAGDQAAMAKLNEILDIGFCLLRKRRKRDAELESKVV